MNKYSKSDSDSDNAVVWRHSPEETKSNLKFSFLGQGLTFGIQIFFLISIGMFFIFKVFLGWGFDFSNNQYWTESRNIKQVAVIVVLTVWLVSVILNATKNPGEQVKAITAVPIEMTSTKIVVNRNDKLGSAEVDIASLKTAVLDCAEGALAVNLRVPHENIILISSEARNLLRLLYVLRPELEPTT